MSVRTDRGPAVPDVRAADTAGTVINGVEGAPVELPATANVAVSVSVLVPTRNEADNVAPLLQRLLPVLSERDAPGEVLFLDDSDDGTPAAVVGATAHLQPTGTVRAVPVRVLHRPVGARERGLGGALETGFAAARGDVVVVLDGDLQHPPEVLPALLAPFADPAVDLTAGSRFLPGGDAGGLDGPMRRAASLTARTVVQVMVPPARGLSDPCGGLFAVRRSLLDGAPLHTHGFQILLELLARTPWRVAVEVPYRFAPRHAGASTLDSAELRRFARHVLSLRLAAPVPRGHGRPSPRGPAATSRATEGPSAGTDRPASPLLPSEDPPAAAPPIPTPMVRPRRAAAWWMTGALLAAFVLGQVAWVVSGTTGPFIDEGTYATAGWRTLRGHGVADGYQSWFAGSLLWPVLTGAAYEIGGLIASRLLAATLVTVGAAASVAAARALYGPRAAAWAAAVMVSSAPLLVLGHLAVYDALSAAGLGVALWSIARLHASDHRRWVLVLAAALVVAVAGKYPVLFLVPPLLLLVVVLRGRRGVVDAVITSFLCAAAGLAYYLPWRFQLSQFIGWRSANDPTFGVTRSMIALDQVYLGAPVLLLALAGTLLVGRAGTPRAAAAVLTASMLIFPAYHLLNGSGVSATKHAAFGVLLAAPVAGLALDRATRSWRWLVAPVAVALLAALAVADAGLARTLEGGWVDVRPATAYLDEHARSGDRYMMSNSWPLLPALYRAGVVTDPSQVADGWAVAQGVDPGDWCAADWVVDERGGTGWDEAQRAAIAACGTFERVVDAPTAMTAMGTDLRYVHWQASTVVWRNTAITADRP